MAWKVTYRDKDGKRRTRTYDAVNRDALFEMLKTNGIMPVRIENGKSRKWDAKKRGKFFELIRSLLFLKAVSDLFEWAKAKFAAWGIKEKVIFAFTTVAVIAGVGYYFGRSSDSNGDNSANNRNGGLHGGAKPENVDNGALRDDSSKADANPSGVILPQGNENLKGNVVPPPPVKDWQTLQREAMARKLGRKKEHEIVYNDSNADNGDGRKPIHRNSTEHIMSMIFTTSLGDMPLPLPLVPERDKQRMAQILRDKFEISQYDPDADEKMLINEVKDALSEHIRKGGDADEFFSSYHRQLKLAHRERREARNMVLETAKSGDAELAVELLEKYNQNLESKGIKPITLPQWVIKKKARKQ